MNFMQSDAHEDSTEHLLKERIGIAPCLPSLATEINKYFTV